MLTHMRTSVDLPSSLLNRARRLAQRRGVTLKALVEEGLRRVLEDSPAPGFKLPDRAFQGDGLVSGEDQVDWDKARAAIYEGRGS
jgi:hypothetical protein